MTKNSFLKKLHLPLFPYLVWEKRVGSEKHIRMIANYCGDEYRVFLDWEGYDTKGTANLCIVRWIIWNKREGRNETLYRSEYWDSRKKLQDFLDNKLNKILCDIVKRNEQTIR